MNATERRATLSLAGLFAMRMLGLFMILPVFAIYGQSLVGATPALLGLAIGAYGLTQALLQVPFGFLSDRIGRKPVIYLGLILFGIGSVVAALSHTIEGVIVGRFLQGAGAIASAVMALLADSTRDEQRSKAMAIVGGSIGLSFILALIVGPVVAGWFNLSGVFWLTAILAGLGLVLTWRVVPSVDVRRVRLETGPIAGQFRDVFKNGGLMRLNVGVFVLHMVLTASFVVMPTLLIQHTDIAKSDHWQIYLPVLFVSFVLMLPMMIFAERRGLVKQVFLAGVSLLLVAFLMLGRWHESALALIAGLLLFFWGFNLLEAMLPSLVSKVAAAGFKGTSMGVYSTCQFFGAFVGGAGGGYLVGHYGAGAVYGAAAVAVALWLLLAASMRAPRPLQSYTLQLTGLDESRQDSLTSRLLAVTGVEEVVIIPHEKTAYLKVDNRCLDKEQLQEVAAAAL
ncbi:MAG: MFS transporter [Gammaproteobacteria bacterium]